MERNYADIFLPEICLSGPSKGSWFKNVLMSAQSNSIKRLKRSVKFIAGVPTEENRTAATAMSLRWRGRREARGNLNCLTTRPSSVVSRQSSVVSRLRPSAVSLGEAAATSKRPDRRTETAFSGKRLSRLKGGGSWRDGTGQAGTGGDRTGHGTQRDTGQTE